MKEFKVLLQSEVLLYEVSPFFQTRDEEPSFFAAWMKDRCTRGGWREEDTELSAVINSEEMEPEPRRSVV